MSAWKSVKNIFGLCVILLGVNLVRLGMIFVTDEKTQDALIEGAIKAYREACS